MFSLVSYFSQQWQLLMKTFSRFFIAFFMFAGIPVQAETTHGFSLTSPAADTDRLLRVLIYHDMEGYALALYVNNLLYEYDITEL